MYTSLFTADPDRVSVMNKSAPGFFGHLQCELVRSLFIQISALDDEPRRRGGQELTIQGLIDAATALGEVPLEILDRAREFRCNIHQEALAIRAHRNQRFAHGDAASCPVRGVPLPGVEVESVRSIVLTMFESFNLMAEHLGRHPVHFHDPIVQGDAVVLLNQLVAASQFHQVHRFLWSNDAIAGSTLELRNRLLGEFGYPSYFKNSN
jgi:hypothetical protein